MPTADSVNLTALSESSVRNQRIQTLQVHHATTTSLEALRALMEPGGRQVSANYAMGNDGNLMLVVPVERRAFTSASADDNRAITVEVCNTTLGPEWGISDASHRRLGKLAAEMHTEFGMPLDRAHIYGHNETPGSYSTACPGPSMNLDLVIQYAKETDDDDMTLFKASTNSTDKLIKEGWLYKQSGDGPVIPVSNLESVFVSGAAEIGGNDLRVLANVYGLAEAEAPGPWTWGGGKGYLGPGRLTGRRIGPDGKAYWPYPASSGAGDNTAVLAAIAEVDKDVAAVASGVAGVPAATAAELSKRLSA